MTEVLEHKVNMAIVETDMERDKLERSKIEKVILKMQEMELIVTDHGRVFHVVGCKHTMPPISSSAKKYKACKDCFARTVRGVLTFPESAFSSGST